MSYPLLSFGERNKPFLMEFPLKKSPGIRWSEAMFLSNSTQDSRKFITSVRKSLLSSRGCSQCALNHSITVPSSTRNSITTITSTSTTGYPAGLELTNPQLEYSMCTNRPRFLLKHLDMSSLFNVMLF